MGHPIRLPGRIGRLVNPFVDNYIKRNIYKGFNPSEKFSGNADGLSWTGWASYTGFVTPDTVSYSNSIFRVYHDADLKYAQRERAAATGAHIALRVQAKVFAPQVMTGVFIDDDTDDGDGLGAQNYVRVICHKYFSSPAWYQTVIVKYRLAGGAEQEPSAANIIYSPNDWVTFGLRTSGTRWTSWDTNFFLINHEGEEEVIGSYETTGFTWTPVNVGLFYLVGPNSNGNNVGLVNWYDEDTT